MQAPLESLIRVGRSQLSPLQYRWLFTDLRETIGAEDEATALWHYRQCGESEILQGRRPSDPERLMKLELQALSPGLGDLPPSDYYRLHRGEGTTLDIIFTFTFMPVGQFNFVEFVGPHNTLLLNTSQNDFYQRGIPGVTRSIDETAQWLRSIAKTLGAQCIRTFGASMGGYAALLFAVLLEADAVYAAAPLIVLGEDGCRSLTWNDIKVFDPAYRSLAPHLPRLAGTANVVYPVYTPFEYRQIDAYLACARDRPMFVRGFHPGAGSLDWGKVMQSPGTPTLSDEITFGCSGEPLSLRTVELGIRADVALRTKRLPSAATALRALVDENPGNVGFCYFLGAVSLALGERDEASNFLQTFAESDPAFSFQQPREDFLTTWKGRILEDFGHILSAGIQRQIMALLDELWSARSTH